MCVIRSSLSHMLLSVMAVCMCVIRLSLVCMCVIRSSVFCSEITVHGSSLLIMNTACSRDYSPAQHKR